MQNPLDPVPEEDESAALAAADPQIGELDVESQQQAAAAPAVSMSDLEGTPSDTTATPQAPARVPTHLIPCPHTFNQNLLREVY